jgi:hypothetical protein
MNVAVGSPRDTFDLAKRLHHDKLSKKTPSGKPLSYLTPLFSEPESNLIIHSDPTDDKILFLSPRPLG